MIRFIVLCLLASCHLDSSDVDYKEIASSVDNQFSKSELLEFRNVKQGHSTDRCEEEPEDSFAGSIFQNVSLHLNARKSSLTGVASSYALPRSLADHLETSLWSHRQCRLSKEDLRITLDGRPMPDSKTIELMRRFATDHNKFKDENDKDSILELYTKLSYCLAYTESLTTADTAQSFHVARKYASSSYTKPPGVKFYEDRGQSPESRLNIGLFQFTPKASGNIHPCVRDWNREKTNCTISESSQKGLINIIGSSAQSFNSYCGINKFVQTYAVQVNTESPSHTHPENRAGNSLLAPRKRCVSLFVRSGYAYNHFGPLQNTTGSNLKKLMSCIYK